MKVQEYSNTRKQKLLVYMPKWYEKNRIKNSRNKISHIGKVISLNEYTSKVFYSHPKKPNRSQNYLKWPQKVVNQKVRKQTNLTKWM